MKDRSLLIEKLTKLSNDSACSTHERMSAKNLIKKFEAEIFNVVKKVKTSQIEIAKSKPIAIQTSLEVSKVSSDVLEDLPSMEFFQDDIDGIDAYRPPCCVSQSTPTKRIGNFPHISLVRKHWTMFMVIIHRITIIVMTDGVSQHIMELLKRLLYFLKMKSALKNTAIQ